MEKSYYLNSTFNEVVFKNRNKSYGAFNLRRVYSKNITFAIFLATTTFTILVAGPLVQNFLFPKTEKKADITKLDDPTVFEIPPTPVLPNKPPVQERVINTQKEKVKTEAYVKPKVVKDDAHVQTGELADYKDLKDASIGKEKIEGATPQIPDVIIAEAPPAGLGAGSEETKPEIFIYAEEMPEFMGGEKALLQYLGKKINYPPSAQRIGIEGLVVVSFVVSETGKIRDAEVLKGLGHGTDEEALRVINDMPPWKPGKQNGRPVAVRYTLPIRFSIR